MSNGVRISQGCNLVILECDTTTPFGTALAQIAEIHAAKGHDYALEGDEWSNFRTVAEHFDIPIWEAADFNELQKLARLKSLRTDGKEPLNEAVVDTYKDKAVYAVLAYAMYLQRLLEQDTEFAMMSFPVDSGNTVEFPVLDDGFLGSVSNATPGEDHDV